MKQKLSESQARSCHAQKEKEEFAGLAVKRGQTIQVCKLADHNEDIRETIHLNLQKNTFFYFPNIS